MKTKDFGAFELLMIENWPGMSGLLSGICDHCHKAYRNPPCDKSDHYRTFIDLAIEANSEPWTSFGCEHPADQQAPIQPSDQKRRHPYSGPRPEWSGYCVISTCACGCHKNEALDEIGEVA